MTRELSLLSFPGRVLLRVMSLHVRLGHSGTYCLISELRTSYFIPSIYSKVKSILRSCLVCRRVNARSVKKNQSFYRDFRENPVSIPFRYSFLDHFGPYTVTIEGKRRKVWVLLVTCLWSRAVNLKVAYDLTVKDFLRCMQLHIYEWGMPERIFSDLGSRLVAGATIISDLIKHPSSVEFFEVHNMTPTSFEQYFRGRNELGSLVESCVKICKRLITKTIRNNVLKIIDFDFLIMQVTHLANKRPIAFQDYLRDNDTSNQDCPAPITPEILLKGYDTPSISVLPDSVESEEFTEWNPGQQGLQTIRLCSEKLQKVRANLKEIYHSEFLGHLLDQAVDRKDRYKPVTHKSLRTGDIVLLKEEFTKASKYPMARVERAVVNEIGEVTGVEVRKGNGELVKRDTSSVIPYMEFDDVGDPLPEDDIRCEQSHDPNPTPRRNPKRRATKTSRHRTQAMFDSSSA